MPNRVKLHIDEISHFNDVTFQVYRDTESDVTESDSHIMNVHEPTNIKRLNRATMETLTRDPDTPYAFYAKRHFKTEPFPEVYIGSKLIEPRDIQLFPEDKMIEIHNGRLGLGDGQNIYMSYDYETIDVVDDYTIESGKDYFGPPAVGIRSPINVQITQDHTTNQLVISYDKDDTPVVYFYRIKAIDTSNNHSPLSFTKYIELKEEIVYFRIERSPDGQVWEEIAHSNMLSWLTDIVAVDTPSGLQDIRIAPLNSKEAKISFKNPWLTYLEDPREPYVYRIRAEDIDGEATPWFIFSLEDVYVIPKDILIRRKVDNGTPSSIDGEDGFDVFRIDAHTLSKTDERIELIDDQLTDATKYGYTFFYTDMLEKKAKPVYHTSDHRAWANLILYRSQQKYDKTGSQDFMTVFELADRVIEIGE